MNNDIIQRSEVEPEVSAPDQNVTAGPLNDIEDGSFAHAILFGLQRKQVYMGTVDPVTIAERRKANKVARRSRRINRLARR